MDLNVEVIPEFVNIFKNQNDMYLEKKGKLTKKTNTEYTNIPYINQNFKLKLLTKVISKITNSKYFPIFPFKMDFHTYCEEYLDIYANIGCKNICNLPCDIKHKIFLLFNKIIDLWFDCRFDNQIITVDNNETCSICLCNFDVNEEIIACQNILNENMSNHCYHFKCYNNLYVSIWDYDDSDDENYFNNNMNVDTDIVEEHCLLIQNLLDKNLKVKKKYSNCMEKVVKENKCVCCTSASNNNLDISFYNKIITC